MQRRSSGTQSSPRHWTTERRAGAPRRKVPGRTRARERSRAPMHGATPFRAAHGAAARTRRRARAQASRAPPGRGRGSAAASTVEASPSGTSTPPPARPGRPSQTPPSALPPVCSSRTMRNAASAAKPTTAPTATSPTTRRRPSNTVTPHEREVAAGRIARERDGGWAVGQQIDNQDLHDRKRSSEACHDRNGEQNNLAEVRREEERKKRTDVGGYPPSLAHRRDDGRELIVGENDRGSLTRRLGSALPHRDADMGATERRRIVDAVARHNDDLSVLDEAFDKRQLVRGRTARIDLAGRRDRARARWPPPCPGDRP